MEYKLNHIDPFGLLLEANGLNDHIFKINVQKIHEYFNKYHLVVLRGFSTFKTAEKFSDFCMNFGEISIWPFGKVLELVEDKNPKDHIFDHRYVPLHWDGMYRPQVPEFQIFHCVSAPAENQGGRTTFSNTRLALQNSTSQDINLWKRVTGVYSREMEFYQSKTVAPVVTTHPIKGFSVIRYCESPSKDDKNFINHPDIQFLGVSDKEICEFQSSLKNALYDPHNFYAHTWHVGDIVIADNYTLLHGRESFISGSPRHIRRVHVLGTPPLDNPHLVFHK